MWEAQLLLQAETLRGSMSALHGAAAAAAVQGGEEQQQKGDGAAGHPLSLQPTQQQQQAVVLGLRFLTGMHFCKGSLFRPGLSCFLLDRVMPWHAGKTAMQSELYHTSSSKSGHIAGGLLETLALYLLCLNLLATRL